MDSSCSPFRTKSKPKRASVTILFRTHSDSSAPHFAHFALHPTERVAYSLPHIRQFGWIFRCNVRASKPRFSSAIFLEYSRSETRTLFSMCSVFACTSLRTLISLPTAASNVRMNGFGSKADDTTLSTWWFHLSRTELDTYDLRTPSTRR